MSNQPQLPEEYLTGWYRPGTTKQMSLVCADMPDRPVRRSKVRATYHADTPCDARCTGAHGDDCECSCGGVNHGIDVYGPR